MFSTRPRRVQEVGSQLRTSGATRAATRSANGGGVAGQHVEVEAGLDQLELADDQAAVVPHQVDAARRRGRRRGGPRPRATARSASAGASPRRARPAASRRRTARAPGSRRRPAACRPGETRARRRRRPRSRPSVRTDSTSGCTTQGPPSGPRAGSSTPSTTTTPDAAGAGRRLDHAVPHRVDGRRQAGDQRARRRGRWSARPGSVAEVDQVAPCRRSTRRLGAVEQRGPASTARAQARNSAQRRW